MPARSFPEIGFQCNPFRALTRAEWVRAVILPREVARAIITGGHLQLLGEMGSGKTSCLLALNDQFLRKKMRSAYEYLPPRGKSYGTQTDGLEVFLLDEAQRLSKGGLFSGNERARLLRAAELGTRLILGSHEDLSPAFRSRGIDLATVGLSAPVAKELAGILERRLKIFSFAAGRAEFSSEAAEWLRTTFGANLRTMEYFLYDYFQSEKPVGSIRNDSLKKALGSFKPPSVEGESGTGIWG